VNGHSHPFVKIFSSFKLIARNKSIKNRGRNRKEQYKKSGKSRWKIWLYVVETTKRCWTLATFINKLSGKGKMEEKKVIRLTETVHGAG